MLAIERLSHSFRTGQEETPVLHELNFRVEQGEMVALLGSSGSGKSTLLNLMAGLMKPTRGSILIAGQAIEKMSENRLAEFRRTHIGFIFQSYELIPHLTVRENVELPLVFQSIASQERKQRALALLQQVGIGDKSDMFPSQLSGGQQQRVSIARYLITKPAIVFADEPTGNLDTKTEKEIIDLLIDLNQNGITFVIVTHEHEVARRTQRILHRTPVIIAKNIPTGRILKLINKISTGSPRLLELNYNDQINSPNDPIREQNTYKEEKENMDANSNGSHCLRH